MPLYICSNCKSRKSSHGIWTNFNPFAEVTEFKCLICKEKEEQKKLSVVKSREEAAKIKANEAAAIRLAKIKQQEIELQAEIKKEEVQKQLELNKYQADQKVKLEAAKIKSDVDVEVAKITSNAKKHLEEKKLEITKIRTEANVEITKINGDAKKYEEEKKIEARRVSIKLSALKLEYDKTRLQYEFEEKSTTEKMKNMLEEKKHGMVEKLLFEKEYDTDKVVVLLNALQTSTSKDTKTKSDFDPVNRYPLLNLRSLTVLKWKDSEGKQHRLNLINAMKNKWKSMCDLMEIPMDTVETLVRDCKGDEEKCCRAILMYWLENGSPAFSATWENVSKILEELELDEVSMELERVLATMI